MKYSFSHKAFINAAIDKQLNNPDNNNLEIHSLMQTNKEECDQLCSELNSIQSDFKFTNSGGDTSRIIYATCLNPAKFDAEEA